MHEVLTTTTEREVIDTRIFSAPRELVFEAWTNPRHLAQWWGPNGFSVTTHEVDIRAGGRWRFIMHGPEKDTEPITFESTVTFTALGDKTEVTMRALFPSAEALEYVVKNFGAIEGGRQHLGCLGKHIGEMAALPHFTFTRVFDAPRERVFGAWTDGAQLARWWGPEQFTNPVCEADARPGGALRIHMRGPDGNVYAMSGLFHEVVTPVRLVFICLPLDAAGNPLFEVLNTVIFDDDNGGTRLTLQAQVTMAAPGAQIHLTGMEQGWNQSLDRLAREYARSEVAQ